MPHTDNVVAFWDLDNDSTDDSGNGHNGTDTAMSYDGTKATFVHADPSYISLSAISLGTTHSMSCWVGWTGSGTTVFIGGSSGNYLFVTDGSSLYYSAVLGNFVSVSYALNSSLHNVVTTRTGTSVKFFVDGSQIGTTQTLGANNGNTIDTLGAYDTAALSMDGTLQSVAIYSDDKSGVGGWITAEYNGGTPKKWAAWQSVSQPVFRQAALSGLGSGGPFFGDPLATNELRGQPSGKFHYDKRRKIFLPLYLGT